MSDLFILQTGDLMKMKADEKQDIFELLNRKQINTQDSGKLQPLNCNTCFILSL